MSLFSINRTPEGWSIEPSREVPTTPLLRRLYLQRDTRSAALRHHEDRTFRSQDNTPRGLQDSARVPRWHRG